ncbi:hypothetical protein M9H77_13104 [Catharanthus roseus]|uniref:Uncharacterized protein n=1 Tax=Catharanthus roseus TaxID=4058 RepID=A0ACC0BJ68_CATRO|nr:hypothetical protein M9H77_13104 [Catharanthus roseus]
MLEAELVQVQEAYAAREREIQEPSGERDWLRRFLAQFLGTIRVSMDSAHAELESRPGDSRPSNYADEAMSENSQSRQLETTRENTPRPERATHTVVENFMIRMTELLETSMATRRNERVPAIGIDEALEQFLKFRPPEFYGEAEQETKAELFLEQLNGIYDTLRYEDTLRVTFVAFRLRGMAKIGGLELSKLGHSRTNRGPGLIFKKSSKESTYLDGFVSSEKIT